MEEILSKIPKMTVEEKFDLMKCERQISYWMKDKIEVDPKNMFVMPCEKIEEKAAGIYRSIPCPKEYKPLIRSKVKQNLNFQRVFNRTEKVWNNRGLPVNSESFCSDARKDAFDMRNWSESLPSTSVSKKKRIFVKRQRAPKKPKDTKEYYCSYWEGLANMVCQVYGRKDKTAGDGLLSTEEEPLPLSVTEKPGVEAILKTFTKFHKGKNLGDKQKKIIARLKEIIQNVSDEGQQSNGNRSICDEITPMSLLQRKEQKLISKSPKISNWPKLHRGLGRNWATDYLFQAARVPPNSTERNADSLSTLNQMKSGCYEYSVQSIKLKHSLNSGVSSWDSGSRWNPGSKAPHNSPNKEDASKSMMNDSVSRIFLVENMHWESQTLDSGRRVLDGLDGFERDKVVESNQISNEKQFSLLSDRDLVKKIEAYEASQEFKRKGWGTPDVFSR